MAIASSIPDAPFSAIRVEPLEGPWLDRVAALRTRRGFWWLDGSAHARFSFAGCEPWAVLRCFGRDARLDVQRAHDGAPEPGSHRLEGDPLDILRSLLPPAPPVDEADASWPFRGGAVGVIGYELAGELEPLARFRPRPPQGRPLPDLCFLLVDRVLALDAHTGQMVAIGSGTAPSAGDAHHGAATAARELRLAALAEPGIARSVLAAGAGAKLPAAARANGDFDASTHAAAVRAVLERVEAGDCYQACLTHRLEAPFTGDPFALHAALRAHSPAPFSAYLELPDATLISSSPERFLAVDEDGVVESRPIKGTRERGATPAADRALADELGSSEKDRAENLMIVDLVRNDLGRVCEIGSVEVPELFEVEAYASVFQLVSTIRGRLRPGCDVFDAIRASFPAGSMTGAPKLAAMQLLARLETGRRGFYSGGLGYVDASGRADLSVVIRTAMVRDGTVSLNTGGGIVADSEPTAEWAEAEVKARALLRAVAASAPAGERP